MSDKKKRSFSDINKKYSFLDEGVDGLKDRNVSRADQSRRSSASNESQQNNSRENNAQRSRKSRQPQANRERNREYDSNLGYTIKMDAESIEKERRRIERKARMEKEKQRRRRRFIFFFISIIVVVALAIVVKTVLSGTSTSSGKTNKVGTTEPVIKDSQEYDSLKSFAITNNATKYYKENNTSTEQGEIPAGTYLENYGVKGDYTKIKYMENFGFVKTENITNESKESSLKVIDGILIVNDEFSLPKDYEPKLNVAAKQAFDTMIYKAKNEGVKINIASDFLSYDMQAKSYTDGKSAYGEYKNDDTEVKAGHSEHQTGLAIDVVDEDYDNKYSEKFAETDAYKWLLENAHKNGFIIRYPEGKESVTGRKFEPWHLRFVGTEVALEMKDKDITLEEYLKLVKVTNTEEDKTNSKESDNSNDNTSKSSSESKETENKNSKTEDNN